MITLRSIFSADLLFSGNLYTGQQTGSVVNSYALTSGTQSMYVGGMNGLSPTSLNGNIDEVRISKGIGQESANFKLTTHEV